MLFPKKNDKETNERVPFNLRITSKYIILIVTKSIVYIEKSYSNPCLFTFFIRKIKHDGIF